MEIRCTPFPIQCRGVPVSHRTKRPEDSGCHDAVRGMPTFIHYGRPDNVLNVYGCRVCFGLDVAFFSLSDCGVRCGCRYGLPGLEYPGERKLPSRSRWKRRCLLCVSIASQHTLTKPCAPFAVYVCRAGLFKLALHFGAPVAAASRSARTAWVLVCLIVFIAGHHTLSQLRLEQYTTTGCVSSKLPSPHRPALFVCLLVCLFACLLCFTASRYSGCKVQVLTHIHTNTHT